MPLTLNGEMVDFLTDPVVRAEVVRLYNLEVAERTYNKIKARNDKVRNVDPENRRPKGRPKKVAGGGSWNAEIVGSQNGSSPSK